MKTSRHFPHPLVIEDGRDGTSRRIESVSEAAEYLIMNWPVEGRGPAYNVVLAACHNALAGVGDAETVRLAFSLAAKQAGIFVRDDDVR